MRVVKVDEDGGLQTTDLIAVVGPGTLDMGPCGREPRGRVGVGLPVTAGLAQDGVGLGHEPGGAAANDGDALTSSGQAAEWRGSVDRTA